MDSSYSDRVVLVSPNFMELVAYKTEAAPQGA